MLLDGDVITHLQSLFDRCQGLEELPHSFDDTLIDKLIDHIDFSDCTLSPFILNGLTSFQPDEQSSVCVSLFARLLEKYLSGKVSVDHALLNKFLVDTEKVLDQDRPPKVFSDLVHLYTGCFSVRSDWTFVLTWALDTLPDESVSVFIRRQIVGFICLFDDEVARTFIHNVVNVFNTTTSTLVQDGVSSLLLRFHTLISPRQSADMLSVVQSSEGAGDCVYQLIALTSPHLSPDSALKPDLWSSELARIQVIVKLVQSTSDASLRGPLIDSVLQSESVKLHHIITLVPFLPEEKFVECLPNIYSCLGNRRKSPMSDIVSLVSAFKLRSATMRQFADFAEACGSRLLESPSLMKTLCATLGADFMDSSDMQTVKLRISEMLAKDILDNQWEVRDSAIEVATLITDFSDVLGDLQEVCLKDPSPYVRASALRCLLLKPHTNHIDLCKSIILADPDPEPRLTAINYLADSLPVSLEAAHAILGAAIEDSDYDVRSRMLFMCRPLLNESKYADDVKKELAGWTEDAEFGSVVRQLLGEHEVERVDPTLRLLSDMLSALRIEIDDTIDCY